HAQHYQRSVARLRRSHSDDHLAHAIAARCPNISEHHMPNRFLTCLAVAVAAWWASDGRAQTHAQPDISTELIVGKVSTNADPFRGWIGVRVRLGSGWKIYWKEPGDAGLPPEFDWSASSNLASTEVHWPAPHRTAMLGVESLGYTGEVLFPVSVQLIDADYHASAAF